MPRTYDAGISRLVIQEPEIRTLVLAAAEVAGGQRALAVRLGVTRGAVEGWIRGRFSPRPEHVEAMRGMLPTGSSP